MFRETFLLLFISTCALSQQVDWLNNIKNKPILDVHQYDFRIQTPGGSLIIGSNSITMHPVPPGLAINNYVYISNGTGTAEAVLITSVGTTAINVTCANTHSGAWTIQSATKGWQEAETVRATSNAGTVYAKAGTYQMQAQVNYTDGATFLGDGEQTVVIPASASANVFVNLNTQASSVGSTGVTSNKISFRNFLIDAGSYTGVNTVHGIRMNLQNSLWASSIAGVRIDGIDFNNVRYAVYGERVYDVVINNSKFYQNTTVVITDTTGDPTYRNFNAVFSHINVSQSNIAGTATTTMTDYIFTCEKCIASFFDFINIEGSGGTAGGINITHASEGTVIANSSIEMFGAGGNTNNGIYLQEKTIGGVVVSPTATQISNTIVDQVSQVGILWTASTFSATDLQVTNSLITANPSVGMLAGIKINGTTISGVSLIGNTIFGNASDALIRLAQAPVNIAIQGGRLQNSNGSAPCLRDDNNVNYLSVSDTNCTAASTVALVDTYGINATRLFWGNTGSTPIPDSMHSSGAVTSRVLGANGNGFIRQFAGYDSGTTTDFNGLAYNFNPTGWTNPLVTGTIDSVNNGTAVVQMTSHVGLQGIVRILAGGVNTSPTVSSAFTQYGIVPLGQVIASAPAAATAGVGTLFYCTDCTTAATCITGGTGHLAVSNGTIWTCQ